MRLYARVLIALFDLIRPTLGYMHVVCIYEVSCSDYAKNQISQQALHKALATILLRVFTCNPIGYYLFKK